MTGDALKATPSACATEPGSPRATQPSATSRVMVDAPGLAWRSARPADTWSARYASRPTADLPLAVLQSGALILAGLGLGLALVGPDLRIRHANHWLTERFGNGTRRCVESYVAAGVQCEPCPWRDGTAAPREFVVDGRGRLQITCSPLGAGVSSVPPTSAAH